MRKKLNKEVDNNKEFVYCSLRKCPHIECLRHNINIPFDILILRDTFNPDKEWNCKDIVLKKINQKSH